MRKIVNNLVFLLDFLYRLKMQERAKYVQKAGISALVGNLILAATKFFLGLSASSMAILGDAADSASDVLTAIVTLTVAKIIRKPSDKDHPWGHERAETVATIFLSFVIFSSGGGIIVSALKNIFSKNFSLSISKLALFAAAISILGKFILANLQNYYAELSNSEIIKANAINMKNDCVLSASIFVGLGAAKIFSLAILDPIIACAVGVWIIKNAVLLFSETNLELMDGNSDKSLYEKLFRATSSVQGVSNPHRARIRKISSRWDIDLDIEVDAQMTVHEAHKIADQVEKAIRKEIPDVFDIMIHIEPAGHENHHSPEQFGLREKDLEKNFG